jgi:hypothetical protein
VRLSAVMDLMLKQMHEQSVAAFRLDARVAVDPDKAVEKLRRQSRRWFAQALL